MSHQQPDRLTIRARFKIPILLVVIAVVASGCGAESTSKSSTRRDSATPVGVKPPTGADRPCAGGGNLANGNAVSPPIGFSPAVFNLKNAWLGRRGKRWVNLYAGAPHKSPRRGTVYLFEIPITNGSPVGPSGYYPAPGRDGPLRITCVRRNTVFLRSRHMRYIFNLQKPRVRPFNG